MASIWTRTITPEIYADLIDGATVSSGDCQISYNRPEDVFTMDNTGHTKPHRLAGGSTDAARLTAHWRGFLAVTADHIDQRKGKTHEQAD